MDSTPSLNHHMWVPSSSTRETMKYSPIIDTRNEEDERNQDNGSDKTTDYFSRKFSSPVSVQYLVIGFTLITVLIISLCISLQRLPHVFRLGDLKKQNSKTKNIEN